MAKHTDFRCDLCGESCADTKVNGVTVPLLIYTVVGVAPNAEADTIDTQRAPMPDEIRAIATQAVPRREYCVNCYAKTHGLAMTVPPVAVVAPSVPPETP